MFKRHILPLLIVVPLLVSFTANAAPTPSRNVLIISFDGDLVTDMPHADIYSQGGTYVTSIDFDSVVDSVVVGKAATYQVVFSCGCDGIYQETTFTVDVRGRTLISLSACSKG